MGKKDDGLLQSLNELEELGLIMACIYLMHELRRYRLRQGETTTGSPEDSVRAFMSGLVSSGENRQVPKLRQLR